MSHQTIAELVDGLDPIDWDDLRRLARLTPGQRLLGMARASAFSRALLRGAFRRRYPDRSIEELNMLLMRYVEAEKERSL